jgi:Domain of unknown function (DUF4252)
MKNQPHINWPWIAGLLCLAFAASPAQAQNAKLNISRLEPLAKKAAEVVDVNLDGPLLQLASKFMNEDDDPDDVEAREIIKNLKGVYVKSFEFDAPGAYSMADVEAIRAQLQAPHWSRIVGVQSRREGENDEVYTMTGSAGKIEGMAIIAAEPKELTIVNIVGPIDIDKLSALEGKMGIPDLGGGKKKSSRKPAGDNEKQK